MSALSVLGCFAKGINILVDVEQLMPDMPEFDVRLPGLIQKAFGREINQRGISIPRHDDFDNELLVAYQSYIYYESQFGPRPNQVYRQIICRFAEIIKTVHNSTRGPNHGSYFRKTPVRMTFIIVQNITLDARHALGVIEQQIAQEAELLRERIAIRKISDIFRNWKARKEAATRIQCAFRGLIGRRLARTLHNNMTLAAAQNRTAAYLRDAMKLDPFYGESHEELATFLTHINDLTHMSGWIHDTALVNPANAAGWVGEYRREVLAITLNFQGQAAIWWRNARASQAGPPPYATPYTWRDDTYTHPNYAANGNILYNGLRTLMEAHFIAAVLRPQPNYKGIDWSAVRFTGRSNEIHSLLQTVQAVATQNNLSWNPPQQLPLQYGPAIVAGIASRFSGAATDWWLQLATKPIQIETAPLAAGPPPPDHIPGLLNMIREKFRSTSYEVDQLRRLQHMKWNENSPLVEFNVDFDQTLRDAQQQGADVNILIDYYCRTLPSDLALSVRSALDQATVFNSALKTLENAMKMAIQSNSTLVETKASKFSSITDEKICSKCGKKGHVARFCNSYSILEAAVKSAKQI